MLASGAPPSFPRGSDAQPMTPLVASTIAVCLAALALACLIVGLGRRKALLELVRSLTALREGRIVRPVDGRFWGALGNVISMYNALIPERAARLTALENDRLMFAHLLDGMNEGVMAIDHRRHLLFANRSARVLFGFNEGDYGRLFVELVRHPQLQQLAEAALNSDAPHREEVTLAPGRWPGVAGSAAILTVHARRVTGAPAAGAVLVFHDITELRRLERMRQDFVANVSHELKTPLAAIRAYTETLLDGAVHDASVNLEFLGRIDEQANRLSDLVRDMLNLARLERGDDAFQHAPLSIAPVVRNVFQTHEAAAQAKGQSLALRMGNVDEAVLVRVDEQALRQILNNLLENAIKYTPERGRITLACRPRDEHVEFEVSDNGIGIARDELPRVFERFYRVDEARSRSEDGTGLGLSIVKHLVQSLGGRIGVRSRLNAGSTFTVSLPRVRTLGQRPTAGRDTLLV